MDAVKGWTSRLPRVRTLLVAFLLAVTMVLPVVPASAHTTCSNTGHQHYWYGALRYDYVYHTQPSGTGEWTYWKRWHQGTFFSDPWTEYLGSRYCA